MNSKLGTKIFIVFITIACARSVFAQGEFDITSASIIYPHRFEPWKFKMEVGLSQVKLPFDWLENSVQAPLLQFHANYSFPLNFTVDARFSSLVVANQFSLGGRWQYRYRRFSANAGYDVGFTFGELNQFGFSSSAKSWINYPNVSVGYRIKDIAFTLKFELCIVTSLYSSQGSNVVERNGNFSNGNTIAIYMEQRLWGDHVFILGLKNSYARYHFMAWPAFSTFNRYYNIPEVYLGLVL